MSTWVVYSSEESVSVDSDIDRLEKIEAASPEPLGGI
jgi:hypothetical protein